MLIDNQSVLAFLALFLRKYSTLNIFRKFDRYLVIIISFEILSEFSSNDKI